MDPQSGTITDRQSRFTLIPVMPEEGQGPAVTPEEMGVPLVREAKFDVRGPQLDSKEALALEQQVERLHELIQEERIEEADSVAEECLSRVIRFPEHRPERMLRWWASLLLSLGVVAGLLYYMFA